jgi:hypothetical protein
MVNAHIGFLETVTLLTLVVYRDVTSRLGMLQSDNVASMKFEFSRYWVVSLSVGDDLPFLEILTDVGFPLLEHVFWIPSSFGRAWTELAVN